MFEPRTQSVSLRWRPELRFYEKRVEILRLLEQAGHLRAFRVGENFIEGRLFSSRHRLTVTHTSLTVGVLTEDANLDQIWDAVSLAFDMLSPDRGVQVSTVFQHVAPIDLSFDEAVNNAYGDVVGQTALPGIRLGDWAVLADVRLSDEPEASGLTEFGIVTAKEVPRRLGRSAGRATSGQAPSADQDLWDPEDFAPVSLFADSTLHKALAADNFLEAASAFWRSSSREVGSFVADLHQRVSGQAKGGGEQP